MMTCTGETHVFGIVGAPVAHSASPAMHAAAYHVHAYNAVYVPFFVETSAALPAAIAGIRALSVRGVNVTVPYKEAVIPFLDAVDPIASQMGAVNTIVNQAGKLVGYNTDGDGFVLSLQEEWGWSPRGASVSMIGAGGSARGIAFALCRAGASSLYVYSRTPEKTQLLCQDIARTYPEVAVVAGGNVFEGHAATLIVQTTPAGMQGRYVAELPLSDLSWVGASHRVVDIVYKPAMTLFMTEAKARGALVLGGAGMLAGQGLLAYRLFTGQDVPYSVMRSALY